MLCFLYNCFFKVAISRGYVYCLIFVFITLVLYLFELWIIWSLWVCYCCLMTGVHFSCDIMAWSYIKVKHVFQGYDNDIRFIGDQRYWLDSSQTSSSVIIRSSHSSRTHYPHFEQTSLSVEKQHIPILRTILFEKRFQYSNCTLSIFIYQQYNINCIRSIHFLSNYPIFQSVWFLSWFPWYRIASNKEYTGSLQKCYGHHHGLVIWYGVSVSRTTRDIFPLS
jgi:hypothetical protein